MSLIITTGDISDADGFICLADYAINTNADILFIMNYPAYFGVQYEKTHTPSTHLYEGFNYGLKEILKRDWNLEQTKRNIIDKIDKIDNILSINQISYLKFELNDLKENLEKYSPTEETIQNIITSLNEIKDAQDETLKNFLNDLIKELTKYKLRDKYMKILENFGITDIDDEDNLRKFKIAYTKVAYYLVHTITQSNRDVEMYGGKRKIQKKKGGKTEKVYFLEGNINAKNPFSVNSIKNELFVYADIIYYNLEAILNERTDFDTFDFSKSYTHIYLDMCGSSIHSDLINIFLRRNVSNIKGFFIMGGVLCDVEPFTIKLIQNVVHRPYFATMNQYYHSNNFINLCNFLKRFENIPFFILPNHAIFTDPDLMDFLKTEFKENHLLLSLCSAYYDIFNGAKKPFDYMISRAVINFMKGNLIVPETHHSFMYVESRYGGTFLTDKDNLTSFNHLKTFRILKETPNALDNDLISKMNGDLLQYPCHILSIEDVINISSREHQISYSKYHTPQILDYNLTLIKYNQDIRKITGINGGFKPKTIKRIRKYKK